MTATSARAPPPAPSGRASGTSCAPAASPSPACAATWPRCAGPGSTPTSRRPSSTGWPWSSRSGASARPLLPRRGGPGGRRPGPLNGGARPRRPDYRPGPRRAEADRRWSASAITRPGWGSRRARVRGGRAPAQPPRQTWPTSGGRHRRRPGARDQAHDALPRQVPAAPGLPVHLHLSPVLLATSLPVARVHSASGPAEEAQPSPRCGTIRNFSPVARRQ
jgi:hypothetical protein